METIQNYFVDNLRINELFDTLQKVVDFYGSYVSNCIISKKLDLKPVYRRGRKFIGKYYFEAKIELYCVDELLDRGTLDCVFVHELAHFIDHVRVEKYSRANFASSVNGTKERAIIELFRSLMVPFPKKRTNYRGRTCEIFAKAIEEYYAIKTDNKKWYSTQFSDLYIGLEKYKKVLYPVVKNYLENLK